MPRKQKTKDSFINSGSSYYTDPFISLLYGVALIFVIVPDYNVNRKKAIRKNDFYQIIISSCLASSVPQKTS